MCELSDQQKELLRYGLSIFKPKPKLTGSEWADKFFYLSPESSSVPGKWITRPWQKEIIDAMTDDVCRTVVVKKPTRVGFTKMLNIVHAYFIDQKPCVQLHYQPNDDEARGYAEDEFEPMVRDNSRISRLVYMQVNKGRKKKEKTTKKNYPGGYIEILGSQSDRNLNRRTAKVAVGDEMDTWVKESGDAGDPVTMMMRRTSDFWDRKNILGGKPVGDPYNPEDGVLPTTSTIDRWYHMGTMEERELPCLKCGHYHNFQFDDLEWDKEYDDDGKVIAHKPETAHFVCENCGHKIHDNEKIDMDKKGRWVAANPEALKKEGIRSFSFWAVLSYSPNVTWADIVKEYIAAKDDKMKLKSFYNEVLARPFENDSEDTESEEVHIIKQDIEPWTVPDSTAFLTMAVDVQLDHFWVEVVAHQYGAGSVSIRHERVETWVDVENVMRMTYTNDGGIPFAVTACPVDSGYKTDEVYEFCAMNSDVAFPVKGGSATMNNPWKITTLDNGLKLHILNVEYFKDMFWAKIERTISVLEKGGNATGLHRTHKEAKPFYFEQITSEHKVTETDSKGRVKTYWKKRKPKLDNHLFDTSVYNTFAGELGGIRFLKEDVSEVRTRVRGRRERRGKRDYDYADMI